MDSNQILSGDKDLQVLLVDDPNMRPINPRWQAATIMKMKHSPYLRNHLTDFDKIWHGNAFGPYVPVWMLKIYDSENLIWQMLLWIL